jgi:hypothetical protein
MLRIVAGETYYLLRDVKIEEGKILLKGGYDIIKTQFRLVTLRHINTDTTLTVYISHSVEYCFHTIEQRRKIMIKNITNPKDTEEAIQKSKDSTPSDVSFHAEAKIETVPEKKKCGNCTTCKCKAKFNNPL